ncbi:MAG: polysulfide reductase NrfD [Lysobacterales bacterium]|jgi:formate-dependent nitrite reductase membrane component NrfD
MSTSHTTFTGSGDSFKLGYRFQSYWDVPMAAAFFFGEFGAGLFLVSFYFGYVPGMILGLLSTGVGKPYFHMSHMGVPGKSWRAIMRPDRSWISRGLISIIFFIPFGALVVLDAIFGWSGGGTLAKLVQLIAVLAALVVMSYQGFAMSHSSAIAIWNSGLIPMMSVVYALTSGAAVTLALSQMFGAVNTQLLGHGVIALVVVNLLVLLSFLHAAYHGTAGARQSADLLTREQFRAPFFGLVFGAGIILPLLLLWLGGVNVFTSLLTALGVVAGFFAFRVLIFKAAVYEPQVNFAARLGLR